MTKILVTGGAGYVGSVSVEALLAAGHDVVVIDDLTTGHRAAVLAGASLVVGSYGDGPDVETLLRDEGVEAILHCAARSLVGESIREPARYYRDNVAGGIALLESARAAGVGRVVFSSTAAVYGVPDSTPIPEDAALRPINPYGETKRTFEGALAWYGRAYGLRSVTLRYFNVAGATEARGEDHDPETHLIPAILAAAAAGGRFTLFGDDYPTPDGTCVRDYVHVSDLASAHLLALDQLRLDGVSRTLNCGYGRGYSVREVVEAVRRVAGTDFEVRQAPRRPGDPASIVASNDQLVRLGWKPELHDLSVIVQHALAWENHA